LKWDVPGGSREYLTRYLKAQGKVIFKYQKELALAEGISRWLDRDLSPNNTN